MMHHDPSICIRLSLSHANSNSNSHAPSLSIALGYLHVTRCLSGPNKHPSLGIPRLQQKRLNPGNEHPSGRPLNTININTFIPGNPTTTHTHPPARPPDHPVTPSNTASKTRRTAPHLTARYGSGQPLKHRHPAKARRVCGGARRPRSVHHSESLIPTTHSEPHHHHFFF